MSSLTNQKGFTLIEVIIYIALFSLLMGTAFYTAFQLIDGSSNLSVKTTAESEGNFVMRKFNWAMTGASDFIPNGSELTINKYTGPNVEIKLNSEKILMDSTGSFLPITTENVKATDLQFELIPASSPGPKGIKATFKINEIPFSITKYIRK